MNDTYLVEEIKHLGYTIRIEIDEHPQDPREFDNLGTMVCFHGRYNLGDQHEFSQSDYDSWIGLKEGICRDKDVCEILPLYMYEHSGISISNTSFSCPWDSGMIGFIYTTKEEVRKTLSVKQITKKVRNHVKSILERETLEYNAFISGEVYGFRVFDPKGDEVDSCWGYLDTEMATEDAWHSATLEYENHKPKVLKLAEEVKKKGVNAN